MPESGWTKPGAKYVKRIPKPGGGFYYLYPEDIKAQARAKFNKIKNTVAEKSGYNAKKRLDATNKRISDLNSRMEAQANQGPQPKNRTAVNRAAKSALMGQAAREQIQYNNSLAGKTDKAIKRAKSAAKKAAAVAADKIGLDERAAYKESQKQWNPLRKEYAKNRYDETLAGKVERAAKPITDKVGKAASAVKAMTGDDRVNRTSYTDMDGNTTHYVGQKGSKKVFKTVNKQKAIMYERDKQKVNKVKDYASAASELAKNAFDYTKDNLKETGNTLARAATIDDNIERAKKKAKVKKAKKKVDKAIKKVKNRLKK